MFRKNGGESSQIKNLTGGGISKRWILKSNYQKLTTLCLMFFLLFQIIGGVFLFAPVQNAKADNVDAWYNTAWSYRKAIIINHGKVSNTDQSNFPVLVSTTDVELKTALNGGKVHNPNGYDIIFTNQDGSAKLDYEIENYDAVNGGITMWVKIPTLSYTTDTIIYIYYGNPNITSSQENQTGVWNDGGSDNFKGVWHMNQNPGAAVPQIIDSAQYANNGTANGGMTSDNRITGQIGSATSFDGSNDYIDAGTDASVASITDAVTMEAWVKIAVSQPSIIIVNGWEAYEMNIGASNYIGFTTNHSNSSYSQVSSNSILDNNWNHIVLTYSLSDETKRFYINGILDKSQAILGSGSLRGEGRLILGDYWTGVSDFFNGSIDEVRISDTVRSADWIKTEYNNQSEPNTFFALGSEEKSMHHLSITGSTSQTAGTTQTLTLTAYSSMGNIYTAYTGDRILTPSGPTTIDSNIPTFTDKDAHNINFGSSGTIHFTNGVATTDIKLYKAESAEIDATDGTYSTTGDPSYDLNVVVSPNTINSFNVSSPSTITSETPFSFSLTSKDVSGNTTTNVSNSTTLSIDYGAIDISSIPNTEFQDDGIYTNNITISQIYANRNIILTIRNGSIVNAANLSVIGVSHGNSFIPPPKPIITPTDPTLGTVPSNITQIAISRTPDFTNISWQPFDPNKFKNIDQTTETLYVKFRTDQGAVSDVIIYTPQASNQNTTIILNEGDIVKTFNNPDVYIIKYKNNKQYKRLILSPLVFKSYGHLKWSNLKIVSQEQLNKYTTSDLVKETLDTIIYHLFPSGDMGERKALNADEAYDIDSVYEVNKVDRDSYNLVK